jgi:acyl carrier protein
MLSLYSLINNRLSSQVNLNDDMLLIEDLHMDSLALMDLVLDIEET